MRKIRVLLDVLDVLLDEPSEEAIKTAREIIGDIKLQLVEIERDEELYRTIFFVDKELAVKVKAALENDEILTALKMMAKALEKYGGGKYGE